LNEAAGVAVGVFWDKAAAEVRGDGATCGLLSYKSSVVVSSHGPTVLFSLRFIEREIASASTETSFFT